jgi:AraC-like DNA-binding protein
MPLQVLPPLPPDGLHAVVTPYTPGCTTSGPPGAGVRGTPGVHQHPCFAIVFVEAGAGEYPIGADRCWAAAGDLFLAAPGCAHDLCGPHATVRWVVAFGVDALGPTRSETELYLALPDELLLAAFVHAPGALQRRLAVPPADRAGWVARLASLAGELAGAGCGAREAAHALLELLLIDVARLAAPGPGVLAPQTSPLLASVFRFVERRFRGPIGLADVAKAVARSPSYLTDLVRRETGRTVQQWIIERRMAEARRLLLASDVRVKDVAPQIGYDDAGHFIRQFRRAHGTTPQDWRLASRTQPAAGADREKRASWRENAPPQDASILPRAASHPA